MMIWNARDYCTPCPITPLPSLLSRICFQLLFKSSYEVALSSVKQAEERLMTKIPYKRPEDYFAEVTSSHLFIFFLTLSR